MQAMPLRRGLGVLLVTVGFSPIVQAQQAPPPELFDIEWQAPSFSTETINCSEETFQVPFGDPGNEVPEWFNSGAGGFQLPVFRIELSSAGTYSAEAEPSLGMLNVESGLWNITDGQLQFSCPDGGCQLVPSGISETVSVASPENVPEFTDSVAHLGGSDIAFYADPSATRRLSCSITGRTFRLRLPTDDSAAPPMPPAPDEMPADMDNCDYTDAEFNAGWGWDPVALLSCPPLRGSDDADCRYDDADVNGGFGWNPVTMLSCPPR